MEAMKTMDRKQMEPVEVINPSPKAPWHEPAFDNINVESNPEAAKQKARIAMSDPSLVVFTDGSATGEYLGAAAVMLDTNGNASRTSQTGVGSIQDWSIHHAELIAIRHATDLAVQEQLQRQCIENRTIRT
jgi:hypothetical protein